MSAYLCCARATRPGLPIFCVVLSALLAATLVACGQPVPDVPSEPRTWQGPGDFVSSSGVTFYNRREIAQRVAFPACIQVAETHYRFARVTPLNRESSVPPGLFDTQFRLDRWRLWTEPGPLPGQPAVYVTVRGSTGLLAEYERTAAGASCAA